MKRIIAIMLCALALFALAGCNKEKKTEYMPHYDEAGVYDGFDGISENYSADKAIADGCLVVEVADDNAAEVSGTEVWHGFLSSALEREESAFLRIVYYVDGTVTCEDLYFADGRYMMFSLTDGEVTKKADFTELRMLENEDATDAFYVLTDSTDLTYEDAVDQLASSSADAVKFEFLPFTFYIAG